MIHTLLPAGVVVVTSDDLDLTDDDAIAALDPSEERLVATASPKRRAEFASARACAREALIRLGGPVAPVLRGGRGAPLWPEGVVGTLSHTEGLRVAAVAGAAAVRSVGLDVEVHGPLPDGVLRTVGLAQERDWVAAALSGEPTVRWDRLLFTAKEAVYKAWYPLTRRWLGFEDARLTFRPDYASDGAGTMSGTFDAEILIDPTAVDGGTSLTTLSGRWVVGERHLASAVVLERGSRGGGAIA